jgi:hypothetical protein
VNLQDEHDKMYQIIPEAFKLLHIFNNMNQLDKTDESYDFRKLDNTLVNWITPTLNFPVNVILYLWMEF